MITAQDIREKTFEKSRMGGYDMAAVDDFLETLANELGAAQKESSVLKSKMKVLVDKIEEYRSNEEALNMALLSAQKLAMQIETEARQRASATIAEAEAKAQAVIGSIDQERISYEQQLAEAKSAKAKYIADAKALAQSHIKDLEKLAAAVGVPEPPKADPVEEPVQSIESRASRLQAEPSFDLDFAAPKEKSSSSKLDNTQTFTV